ncbi:MAG TPA: hypothetical protein VKQ32_27155 [Polyangia bacterium]|nr:hypothetical protein [Polyangia bacterium]
MVAAVAALAGCVSLPDSVTYAAVNTPPRAFARRNPAAVDVFIGKPPTRPHVDVGLFEVYQGANKNGTASSTEDMIATLRTHAGLRGCDAVQVLDIELAGKVYWRIVRGVCEMYTDAQAQQTAGQTAAFTPLPGEGSHCSPPDPNMAPNLPECPDPLVCTNKVCVSPYH